MLETTAQLDPAAHAECLGFIRYAIATADRQTARDIAAIVKEVYENGHADRAAIWRDLLQAEQNQFRELLGPPPLACDFARRIREALGYNSPAVAGAIQTDLERVIDRGELVAADVAAVVDDRNFLDFQELVTRCPKYFAKLPAPQIEAATKKNS
ncbi:hypothetical protein IQ269_17745 [Tychonema sp. LEGE 07199]|uniref:hypothetical protein n=1 Tax=unclassified Tychonema TaxID=2642144 RepID=UPI00187E2038|nr:MULTISPECIES: hypothetical protein [unclassified Tychonema]MBE9122592.1 hypothetical protein [Tychonema sp. LEGE 07199]MBE9133914.1 hypothetical protein [Tychonema sp. LEGE 07196]